MALAHTVAQIKRLEIQGAANIAKAALGALREVTYSSRATTLARYHKELERARDRLYSARETEPYLRNVVELVLREVDADTVRVAKEQLHSAVQDQLKHMQLTKEQIAESGSRLIRKGDVVFTHCHSSMAMAIIKKAHDQGKKIRVVNTEARPLYQGRITAKELSDYGIEVTHYCDSAARLALKESNIAFIGADAVTPHYVANKIGSELFAESARRFHVPFYCATPALKLDPLTLHGHEEPMEERNADEIWEDRPKRVRIMNPAFEKVHHTLITGIISELGVHKHTAFLRACKKQYKGLF